MRSLSAAVVAALTAVTAPAALAETVNFDAEKAGALGAGWQTGITGKGAARWEVVGEADAPSKPNAVKQSGVATYALALRDGSNLADGFAEVKFKAVSGSEDRAAGIVWRAKDMNNYYVVRANALEDNVVLYKTVGGKRSSIVSTKGDSYGVKAPVPPNQWHTLRVEFKGARFKVALNGKPLFEVEDKSLTEAGKVGLWTKADSVTLFDDFSFGQ